MPLGTHVLIRLTSGNLAGCGAENLTTLYPPGKVETWNKYYFLKKRFSSLVYDKYDVFLKSSSPVIAKPEKKVLYKIQVVLTVFTNFLTNNKHAITDMKTHTIHKA